MSSTINPNAICDGFDGNADLYGLGIRVGVYLQWYSTWLSISFDSESAQETHDANSIFVFAIIIAVVQAAASDSIRPVEAFIMIQICFGFLFTILSIFGLRLQFLGRMRLARLVASVQDLKESMIVKRTGSAGSDRNNIFVRTPFWDKFNEILPFSSEIFVQGTAKMVSKSRRTLFRIPMSAISFLKHKTLSWTGVLWRSIIAGVIVSTNLWLWYSGLFALSSGNDCEAAIFMFSRQILQGSIVSFLRVMGIIYAVIVYIVLLYVALIALRVLLFFYLCLYRQLFFQAAEIVRPGSVGEIRNLVEKLHPFLDIVEGVIQKSVANAVLLEIVYPFLKPEFWATPFDQIPHLSDLLKVYVVLSSPKVVAKVEDLNNNTQSERRCVQTLI